MKITDVKLRFAKHYLFVQIYTDAGITGLGEAGNWGYLQATAAAIEKFADYLIGKDPFRIEDFNQNFLRSVYFRGSVIMSAISAIDIALWDIKGKALGVPVYELLGGKTREKVRVLLPFPVFGLPYQIDKLNSPTSPVGSRLPHLQLQPSHSVQLRLHSLFLLE